MPLHLPSGPQWFCYLAGLGSFACTTGNGSLFLVFLPHLLHDLPFVARLCTSSKVIGTRLVNVDSYEYIAQTQGMVYWLAHLLRWVLGGEADKKKVFLGSI